MQGWVLWAALAFTAGAALAQNTSQAPIASSPVVELRGTISKVSIHPGEGMPFLEVKTASGTTIVRLGSIRH